MTDRLSEHAEELLLTLQRWAPSPGESPYSLQNYMNARRAVSAAVTETAKYIVDYERQGKKDIQKERELSRLWGKAQDAMEIFDDHLAYIFGIKRLGWIDPDFWNSSEATKYDLSIENITKELKNLRPPPAPTTLHHWFPTAGVIFATFTVGSLFYLLIRETPIHEERGRIFDAWLAFCFAASTAFIGGTAVARGKLPFPRVLGDSPVRFVTGGGVAIFIIIFLLLRNA